MSCVIGLVTGHGVIFGADAAANDGNILIPNAFKKIVVREVRLSGRSRRAKMLIGTVGSMQIGAVVKHHLEIPDIENPSDLNGYMETLFITALKRAFVSSGYDRTAYGEQGNGDEILVGMDRNLYFIDQNFGVASTMREFDAIGSSREVALGSLWTTGKMVDPPTARQRVLVALDASAELTIHVAGPYQVEDVKGFESA